MWLLWQRKNNGPFLDVFVNKISWFKKIVFGKRLVTCVKNSLIFYTKKAILIIKGLGMKPLYDTAKRK